MFNPVCGKKMQNNSLKCVWNCFITLDVCGRAHLNSCFYGWVCRKNCFSYSYFVVGSSKTRHLVNTIFRRRGEEQKTSFSFLNKKEPFVPRSGLLWRTSWLVNRVLEWICSKPKNQNVCAARKEKEKEKELRWKDEIVYSISCFTDYHLLKSYYSKAETFKWNGNKLLFAKSAHLISTFCFVWQEIFCKRWLLYYVCLNSKCNVLIPLWTL